MRRNLAVLSILLPLALSHGMAWASKPGAMNETTAQLGRASYRQSGAIVARNGRIRRARWLRPTTFKRVLHRARVPYVYEVLRTYGGKPFDLDVHLERLVGSSRLMGIPLGVSRDALAREIQHAVAAVDHRESSIQLFVTRRLFGEGTSRRVFVTPLKLLDEVLYRDGVKVCLVNLQRPGPAKAKTGRRRRLHDQARAAAERQGGHEALIVDADGRVTEGSSSNLFMIKDRVLITPPLEDGILEGTTRRRVLSVAENLAQRLGMTVEQRSIAPAQLGAADEVFITSSSREILPVTRVDDQRIGDGRPGPLTKQLHQGYRELVLGRSR